MISPRFAGATAVVLALALVPTVIHSYLGVVTEDGISVRSVPETLEGMPSTSTQRRPGWVVSNFDTSEWIERVYRTESNDVTLFVGHGYDGKRFYHHPELALLRGTRTVPAGTARVASAPDVPLHVVETERQGKTGVSVYALISEGTFIESPIAFQLQASARLLVGGRRPMTLVMATDLAGRRDQLDRAPATRVLLAALRALKPRQESL